MMILHQCTFPEAEEVVQEEVKEAATNRDNSSRKV
jgi:hypothetical protein